MPGEFMLRMATFIALFAAVACQYKAKEDASELISGHVPVENRFTIATPAAGIYNVGDTITAQLTFPFNVTVDTTGGTPRLALDIDGVTEYANYASGNGGKVLTFSYAIASGDDDADGISIAAIDLNGGTLTFVYNGNTENCNSTITSRNFPSVIVDTTDPSVSSVTAPANATYLLNMDLVFTVNVSESVTISGSPRLQLTVGSTTRYATYYAGSGTGTLLFRYTIVSSDIDANGIAVSASIDLNSGTIRDAAGNDSSLTFTSPNTTGVLANGDAPYVTAFTPPANGNYESGQALDFVLTYSEAVNVTGTPNVSLTIGTTPRSASYQSGSGSTQLTFRYVLQPIDLDADGIAAAATLNMTGATIRDAGLVSAINALVIPSLTGVRVVDNTPRVSSFTVTNSTYYIGQAINITAVYTQAVTITGTPRIPIALTTGGPVYATYVSGTGTTNILFRYTVAEGTDDTNGIVITSPMELSGGTIKGAGNIDANLSFTPPSTPSVRVSGIRPTVTSVTPPANATYLTGANMDFVVNFSEAVTVGGTPTTNLLLNLTVGVTPRTAAYISGSGSTALTFRYVVDVADADTDGITVGTLLVNAPGYITDGISTNNLATVTFSAPNTSGVLVNATVPSIALVSAPASATYLLGQNIDFTVDFSEAVTVVGSPTLSLTVGATPRTATYLSGSGTTSLVFRHTVQTGDVDSDGIAMSSPVALSGGTIRSSNGVNATLTYSPPVTTGVLVDGDEPNVISVTVPPTALYDVNNVSLTFTATFDQVVTVTGSPRWVLNIGGTTRYATYSSGSGTSTLTFIHTINASDVDLDGIAVANSSNLDLNGGTILDANSNPTALSLGNPNTSGIYLTYTGMMGWWDFNVSASVTTVSCGLQQCVSAVDDRTGTNNMTQVTTTARPEYYASGFGTGNTGYVQFDGTTDFLNITTAMTTIRTMLIVFRTEAAAMTTQDLFHSSAGGANARIQVTAAGALSYGGTAQAGWSRNGTALTGNATTGASALSASTVYILAVRFSANQTVAATQRLGNTNFGGQIAEVMTFSNNALTDTQLLPLINYLNAKHGAY